MLFLFDIMIDIIELKFLFLNVLCNDLMLNVIGEYSKIVIIFLVILLNFDFSIVIKFC